MTHPDYFSIFGPVERLNENLVLRIPLQAGGDRLADVATGIGKIVDDELIVTIPDWLAEKIGIAEGTGVYVDDRNGKFNITKEAAN